MDHDAMKSDLEDAPFSIALRIARTYARLTKGLWLKLAPSFFLCDRLNGRFGNHPIMKMGTA